MLNLKIMSNKTETRVWVVSKAASDRWHLMDYVLDLHIITGPNGMCRCGEDGITCLERLRRVSHEIGSALLGAHMVKSMGGEKFTQVVGNADPKHHE